MGHSCDALFSVAFAIFCEIGEIMMTIDLIFGGIAFVGVVLAIGKYAYTSKQIKNDAKTELTHLCLCQECGNFKPKEKEIL